MSKNSNTAKKIDVNSIVEGIEVVQASETQETKGRGRKYDAAEVKAEAKKVLGDVTGVSAQIRKLAAAGWERGKIAVALDKRYQHVRNVLIAPVKNA